MPLHRRSRADRHSRAWSRRATTEDGTARSWLKVDATRAQDSCYAIGRGILLKKRGQVGTGWSKTEVQSRNVLQRVIW
jgi:hypothetical protein